MTAIPAYPLQWPTGRARKPRNARIAARFGTSRVKSGDSWRTHENLTVADAVKRLQDELDRLGAIAPVLSTNVEPRLDGLPRSGMREPDDPGIAVYFQAGGKPYCLPCDTYHRVADNIAAVAAHIEATRAILRYGVGTVSEMFSGFAALPPPAQAWRSVLAFEPTDTPSRDQIEARFRNLARTRHPDAGGSGEAMAALNDARAVALREVGRG